MSIHVELVKHWPFATLRQTVTEKDAILYALALGYGSQPTDAAELSFVYEQGLQAVPTWVTTLCHPGFWVSEPATGIDATKVVHGEQLVTFHAPLPTSGVVRGEGRVLDILDKGAGKGALLMVERKVYDDATGVLLASIEQRIMCRGDGGFSAAPVAKPALPTAPLAVAQNQPPDHVIEIQTLPQAALIYRLCADMNPLHADPAVALAAGFERPILHGLCTYGIAARAIITACCGNDAKALKFLGVRFSAPVYPGELIRTEIWKDPDKAGALRFRCLVPARNTVVITHGVADVSLAKQATTN
jgi:acyl dehydratase